MSDHQLPKDLIQLNAQSFTLKKNTKALESLREFLSNGHMNRLLLNSEDPILLKALASFVRKNYKFNFTVANGRDIKNVVDCLRSSVVLSVKSFKDVYEGEVTEIKIIKDEIGTICDIEMSLKTNRMTKSLRLNKYLFEIVNQISIGDVVYIEPNIGIVKRIGRSEDRFDEYDLEGDKYVQLSKGAVHSVKERDFTVSAYDIDYGFNKYNEDISFSTRKHTDEIILDYISKNIAQFQESCLCIENCHLLSKSTVVQLIQASDAFPSVKILLSGMGSKITCSDAFDGFFVLNLQNEEDILELLKYDCKKLENVEFLDVVGPVLNRGNYELILSILDLSESSSEFMNIYNLQKTI